MSCDEQMAYGHYAVDCAILRNTMITARGKGWMEGRAESHAEGVEQGRKETNIKQVRLMREKGFPAKDISTIIGLNANEFYPAPSRK